MSSPSLNSVLDKMENVDPDYRYMATSDLINYLKQPNARTDFDTQKRLCRGVIKLLKDTSSEVQGMAMKCLAPLSVFVGEEYAIYLVEKLLEPIVDSDENLARTAGNSNLKSMRDVAFLGLKAILNELPPGEQKSEKIARSNVPKILKALKNSAKTEEVHIEALELLNELLKKLGDTFPSYHQAAMEVIVDKLQSQSSTIRKRAVNCIGSLGVVCELALFTKIMGYTIENLENTSDINRRTGVQALWALAKTSGARLGTYLDRIVPVFFNFCTDDRYEADNELREQCVQAIESFCTLCRKQMEPFTADLRKLLLVLAKHDPYYAGDDEDDLDDVNSDRDCQEMDDGDDEDEDDDAFFDGDDDDFSDDDDTSWKVRRASIRCIRAIVQVQLLPIEELYNTFALFLVSRFKERAENVKIDAFDAFISLLQVRVANIAKLSPGTIVPSPTAVGARDNSEFAAPMDISADGNCAMDVDTDENKELAPLYERALHIVRTIRRELASTSVKTRTKAMSVLSELVIAVPKAFCPLFGKVINEVEKGLADEVQLKGETLRFVKGAVVGGGSETLKPFIARLVPKIIGASEDRFYKITAESLRLSTACVSVFGPASNECRKAIAPHCSDIYDSAEKRIMAQDQDSEVKVAALDCIGVTVSFFGDDLGEKRLANVGNTLCSRLRNEVTRLASVRAMLRIALSEKRNVFVPITQNVTKTTVAFLRKNNAALRAAALELLASLPEIAREEDDTLLTNICNLINESDMKLSYYALRLCSSLVKSRGSDVCPGLAKDNGVYHKIIALSTSPLLQGRVVTSLLAFFQDLAMANGEPLTVQRLVSDLNGLLGSVEMSTTQEKNRSSPLNILAQCVASVCSGSPQVVCSKMVSDLTHSISENESKARVFALITLGEFGKRSLLNKEQSAVQEEMLKVLDSNVAEVKTAAALAMGGIASASGKDGIPSLIHLIHERPQLRYLLLLSLKDAIAFSPLVNVANSCSNLLSLLIEVIPQSLSGMNSNADTNDQEKRKTAESIRIAAAECLGLLVQCVPQKTVAPMTKCTKSANADVRATVMAAVRFAVSTQVPTVQVSDTFVAELKQALPEFLDLVKDSDVTVAKDALLAIQALARSRPNILAPLMRQVTPLVFQRTPKNPELVRKIDLGPFQYEEDYGLDLRKVSFAIMRLLVAGPLVYHTPMNEYLERVVVGLRDVHDVRAVAQQAVIALARSKFAPQLLAAVEPILSALEKTMNEKIKDNAVRQEVERHEEAVRGALRTFCALESVQELADTSALNGFKANMIARKFREQYNAVTKEVRGVERDPSMSDFMQE